MCDQKVTRYARTIKHLRTQSTVGIKVQQEPKYSKRELTGIG